jgi:hypothetical protein
MENIENLEVVETSENVEQTTEQTPKTYTQEEVDAIVGKRVARNTAKITKQFERKYERLENVLKAGTGKESVEEFADTFEQFYRGKGIQIPEMPEFTDKDIKLLAKADADEIISSGIEEVVEEADRLNALGMGMSGREKAVFVELTNYIKDTETGRELSKIGVTEDVYSSQEFKDFASKFNSNTPIRDIYDIYAKTQPKKNIKPMGSMRTNGSADNGIKDFYSFEEASKFTKADFDKNPALFDAVRKSMPKWK